MTYSEIANGLAVSLQDGHMPQFLYGLDADKPGSPGVGDTYYATDVNQNYICFTAGTWINISPFLTVNVVTADRAKNTTYTNNSGKLMFVVISFSVKAIVAGGAASGLLKTGTDDPPTTDQSIFSGLNIIDTSQTYTGQVTAIVPASHNYRLVTTELSGAVSVVRWVEVT